MASTVRRAAAPRLPGVGQLEEIGRGGYSVVYRGWQAAHERWVALKVLHEGTGNLSREARALGSLSEHPNVVALFGSGEIDGRPYLLMPYLSGGSLQDRLNQGPMDPADAVAAIGSVAAAVEEAHGRGILHRDIKPANILFTSYGVAQLADFGIARFSDSTLTETGLLAATVAYTAPEVLSGGRASPLSDVYSLGATLDAALRGGPAYASRNAEPAVALAVRVVGEEPPPLLAPGVPADLAALVARCMAKDPARRPQSAAALRTELTAWAGSTAPAEVPPWPEVATVVDPSPPTPGPTVPADPPTPLPPVSAGKPASQPHQAASPGVQRRRRSLLVVAAGAVVVVAAGAAVGLGVGGSGGSTPAAHHAAAAAPSTPPPTSAARSSAARSSAARSPETTPSTSAAPSTPAPSTAEGPPSVGGAGSAAAVAPSAIEAAVTSYYGLVGQHALDQSWTWLSPAFQARIGRAYYDQFWTSYSAVQVTSVTASGGDATVSLRYTSSSGATTSERDSLGYVVGSGHLLIDTDQVVG